MDVRREDMPISGAANDLVAWGNGLSTTSALQATIRPIMEMHVLMLVNSGEKHISGATKKEVLGDTVLPKALTEKVRVLVVPVTTPSLETVNIMSSAKGTTQSFSLVIKICTSITSHCLVRSASLQNVFKCERDY